MSIGAVRNRKHNNFFVKSFWNEIEYLEIKKNKGKTFKLDIDKIDYYTYNLDSLNKDLPYCQCIDW